VTTPDTNFNPPRLTDDALRQALADDLEALKSRFDDIVAYIDTVSILSTHQLTGSDHHELRALGCSEIINYRSKSRRFGYRIQQPTRAAIEYLAKRSPGHLVSTFDVSLDFITSSQESASIVDGILQKHITQPWHGRRRASTYEETLYAGKRGSRRNIVVYATRLSKIRGTPCAHLELRYATSRACAARGVRHLNDLLAFDPCRFLSRDVRLSDINWYKAERIFDDAVTRHMHRHNQIAYRISKKPGKDLPRMNRTTAQQSLLEFISSRLREDVVLNTASDLSQYPIIESTDSFKPLRQCAVHVRISTLIKNPIHLFWE
jgi:hypothetical protein